MKMSRPILPYMSESMYGENIMWQTQSFVSIKCMKIIRPMRLLDSHYKSLCDGKYLPADYVEPGKFRFRIGVITHLTTVPRFQSYHIFLSFPDCEDNARFNINPCKNGGKCVTQTPNYSQYQCKCVLGFYGQNCTR